MKLLCLLFALSVAVCAHAAAVSGPHDVSSLCLKCLCEGSTTGCDHGAQCDSYGFCGPFRISENYWREAGAFENDFKKCANNYDCAERTVKAYMQKFGKDCDGDGDVDCLDYALIHHKGRNGCPYADYASDSLYKYVDSCVKRAPQESQTLRQDVAQSMKEMEHQKLQKNIPERGELMANIKEGGSELGHKVSDSGDKLKKNLEGQAENVQEKGMDIGGRVKDSLKSAKENVEDKFKNAKENVQDKFKSGKESMQENIQSGKDNLQDKARQISEKIQGQGQNIGEKASDLPHEVHREGEKLHDEKQHSGTAPLPEMIRHRRAALEN